MIPKIDPKKKALADALRKKKALQMTQAEKEAAEEAVTKKGGYSPRAGGVGSG